MVTFSRLLVLMITTFVVALPLSYALTENTLKDNIQSSTIKKPTVVAEKPQQQPDWLIPYTANYTIFRDGDKSGTASRSLKKINDGWELISYSRAKVYFFKDKRTEKSTFTWEEKFRPLSYHYEIKNSFKKQITKEAFDWDAKTVSGTRGKDRQWEFPISEGLADPLNHQILIREQLILREKIPVAADNNKNLPELVFNVSSKGQSQPRTYQILGEETLSTKAGVFKTIKLQRKRGDRKTIFWMAKELNFVPVKIYQEKEGEEQATMIITEFEAIIENK